MPSKNSTANRVRQLRQEQGWSQLELAQRAGISRTAVGAIEAERLVPSVAAALSLAQALETTVEHLFGSELTGEGETSVAWAWEVSPAAPRFWQASVNGRRLRFPVESTPLGELPHDGVASSVPRKVTDKLADETLVMASCDPAVGILARIFEQTTGYRMLVFSRSSSQSLQLLRDGVVHLAGIHLGTSDLPGANEAAAKSIVGEEARLIHVASWVDGVAVGERVHASTVRGVLRDRLTWVGREAGSGARKCLDELFDDRPAPRRVAHDHRSVADAIRCGWADAGVCLRLVAEEAGLRFLPVQTESYDLCYRSGTERDPRLIALFKVLHSHQYRRLLGELPGYSLS